MLTQPRSFIAQDKFTKNTLKSNTPAESIMRKYPPLINIALAMLIATGIANTARGQPSAEIMAQIEQAREHFSAGNREEALSLFQGLADQGNRWGQFFLGMHHECGCGIPQNFTEAARLYELSSAQGFIPAYGRLGNLYEHGRGIASDLNIAVQLYRRGAELGDDYSAFFLGKLHELGHGVERNPAEAVRLYRYAASQGNHRAITVLAIHYMDGEIVERDLDEARRLLELAADRSPVARRLLDIMNYGDPI